MALFLKWEKADYIMGVWKMEESLEELLLLLPEHDYYEEQLAGLKAPHRKIEFLSVRVLLFTLLRQHAPIWYRKSGKPYLKDSKYSVSISHTKGYAAVILSHHNSVGIDIEQYGKRVQRVLYKFVRDDEVIQSYLGDDVWSMLLHWSAKETLFKCIDQSEIDFKEHLHIFPFAPQSQGRFEACEYKTPEKKHFDIEYFLNDDFVMTWYVG